MLCMSEHQRDGWSLPCKLYEELNRVLPLTNEALIISSQACFRCPWGLKGAHLTRNGSFCCKQTVFGACHGLNESAL